MPEYHGNEFLVQNKTNLEFKPHSVYFNAFCMRQQVLGGPIQYIIITSGMFDHKKASKPPQLGYIKL